MSPFRYRDDDESSVGTTIAGVLLGAAAGFAVGMLVAQRVGGFSGLTARLKRRAQRAAAETGFDFGVDDEIEEELDEEDALAGSAEDDDFNGMDDDGTPTLEERVLEAFTNDATLAERAIDIGSMGDGIIELAGWVENDEEAEHAMTIAGGVPGVDTVVNRLLVDDEERELDDTLRRRKQGDPALEEKRWEGQQVGTGRRRQGTSDETDRHADPKPVLEDRWLSEREALKNPAEDLDEIAAERRKKGAKKAPRADEAET